MPRIKSKHHPVGPFETNRLAQIAVEDSVLEEPQALVHFPGEARFQRVDADANRFSPDACDWCGRKTPTGHRECNTPRNPIEFWRPVKGEYDKAPFTKMADKYMEYSARVASKAGVEYETPAKTKDCNPLYGARRDSPVLVRTDAVDSFKAVTKRAFEFVTSVTRHPVNADGRRRERSYSPSLSQTDFWTHPGSYHMDTNASALIKWCKSSYFQEYYRVSGLPSLKMVKSISAKARTLILSLGEEYGSAWVGEQLILSFEPLMHARLSVLQACGDSSPFESPSLPRCVATQLDTLVEGLDTEGTPQRWIKSNLSFTLRVAAVATALTAKGRAVLRQRFRQLEEAEVQLNANKRMAHSLWLEDNTRALHQRMALHVDMLMRRRNGPDYQYLRSPSEVDTGEMTMSPLTLWI